jgi:hypothetical protein
MDPCFSPGILNIFFPVVLRLDSGPLPPLTGLATTVIVLLWTSDQLDADTYI